MENDISLMIRRAQIEWFEPDPPAKPEAINSKPNKQLNAHQKKLKEEYWTFGGEAGSLVELVHTSRPYIKGIAGGKGSSCAHCTNSLSGQVHYTWIRGASVTRLCVTCRHLMKRNWFVRPKDLRIGSPEVYQDVLHRVHEDHEITDHWTDEVTGTNHTPTEWRARGCTCRYGTSQRYSSPRCPHHSPTTP